MEILYFTAAAVALYFGADWLLNKIEESRGKRFQNRSFIFFLILVTSAVVVFNLIQLVTGSL